MEAGAKGWWVGRWACQWESSEKRMATWMGTPVGQNRAGRCAGGHRAKCVHRSMELEVKVGGWWLGSSGAG